MTRSRACASLLAGAVFLAPGDVAAQVAWDSPMLVPPQYAPGFGIFLLGPAGGDLGVLATFRSPGWNFGVRGGIAEESGQDDVAVLAGLDYEGVLTRSTREFPLDVDWVVGAGFSAGDDFLLSFPLGLTAGHSFTAEEGVVFTPYATPRVVLDALFGDNDDRVDLDFAFDLGLDLRFTPDLTVRFGATLGDREAVAIGLVF
ncbi:MAG: hypothetical protein ACREM1_06270 [Longimicrobiales bacterium]